MPVPNIKWKVKKKTLAQKHTNVFIKFKENAQTLAEMVWANQHAPSSSYAYTTALATLNYI